MVRSQRQLSIRQLTATWTTGEFRSSTFLGGPDEPTCRRHLERGLALEVEVSAVIWFILLVGFLLCLPVLLEASWVFVAALAVLALVLAFPASWVVRRLFRRQRDQRFRTSYLKAFLAALMCCGIILAAPIFYLALLTGLRPMTVPQATLSNGSKTVVFQGMMHVGSEGFYKGVVYGRFMRGGAVSYGNFMCEGMNDRASYLGGLTCSISSFWRWA